MQGESNKIRHFLLSHQIHVFQTRSAPCSAIDLLMRGAGRRDGFEGAGIKMCHEFLFIIFNKFSGAVSIL
jgi:hypothetical protein